MKLFISYPSDQRELAERLRLALEEEDHEVFTDRAELREGHEYHEALRKAVEDADALVYLVTPRSVAHGSYALTELGFAQRRWRTPSGRVLPVVVQPTPIESIPPYLRAVTLLQPQGDAVAETVAAVARLRPPSWKARAAAAAALLALVAAGGGWWAHQQGLAAERLAAERAQEAARAQQAREAMLAAEVQQAAQLCDTGSHALAWDQFERIARDHAAATAWRTPREDCAMRWLREMRAVDKQTFSEQVQRVQPALAEGLARAEPARRADLRAHLGWAEFLRSRDGIAATADPQALLRAALADDAGNVYARTMLAHQLLWRGRMLDDEVKAHFDAALATPRERGWVRGMQFSATFLRQALLPYGLVVADQMRRSGEAVDPARRDDLRRAILESALFNATDRGPIVQALGTDAALATLDWLWPDAAIGAERLGHKRFARALWQRAGGDAVAAKRTLEALRQSLAGEDNRLSRSVQQLLQEWKTAPG